MSFTAILEQCSRRYVEHQMEKAERTMETHRWLKSLTPEENARLDFVIDWAGTVHYLLHDADTTPEQREAIRKKAQEQLSRVNFRPAPAALASK